MWDCRIRVDSHAIHVEPPRRSASADCSVHFSLHVSPRSVWPKRLGVYRAPSGEHPAETHLWLQLAVTVVVSRVTGCQLDERYVIIRVMLSAASSVASGSCTTSRDNHSVQLHLGGGEVRGHDVANGLFGGMICSLYCCLKAAISPLQRGGYDATVRDARFIARCLWAISRVTNR
eukprot:5860954-Amphidinium_carterae.1